MHRLKQGTFKSVIGMILTGYLVFTVLILGIFLFLVKNRVHSEKTESYLDVSQLTISNGIAVISPKEFEKALVSGESIREKFANDAEGAFYLLIGGQAVAFVILGWGLCRAYRFYVICPAQQLSAYFEKWEYPAAKEEKQAANAPHLPNDFVCVQKALEHFEENTYQVYTDFRHLSTYASHEYKNALALLKAKIQNGNTQGILPIIDDIVKDMDDILTLCTNKNEGFTDKIDLALVCAAAVDEFKKLYRPIVFTFQEEEDTSVRGNELWIYRAVCNLLDNAVKYGNNGQITVTAGSCHDCPFLEVSDQGVGIDSNERDKIFQDGYQNKSFKKEGYGIGLSLVKHVARLSNAYLWIKSEKGKGTSFKMIFPSAAL